MANKIRTHILIKYEYDAYPNWTISTFVANITSLIIDLWTVLPLFRQGNWIETAHPTNFCWTVRIAAQYRIHKKYDFKYNTFWK